MRWTRRHRMLVVTGGAGFLGRHLLRAASDLDCEMVAPSSAMLDVTNRWAVLDRIPGWKPTLVVHLAYRKDPRTIVAGSTYVAEAAASCGARLVHLSSDMVFAGRDTPYVEADIPDAAEGYGRWKAEAEAAVSTAAPGAVLVRTSLLYGTDIRGHCEQDVAVAADGRRPMAFYTDEVRCPTFAGDVAAAVMAVGGMADVSGPLHVVGPEAVSRYDLAVALARSMGYSVDDVVAGTAAGTPRGASRIVLDTSAAQRLGIHCRPITDLLR